jgi:hypothetical protein
MKKFLFSAVLFFGVMSARFAQAQVYVPGYSYYAPYGYAAPYAEPQYYDPYAELHALHYQLYLPYPYYAYPYYGYYCCGPVVTVPPRVVNPSPRPAVPPAKLK